LLVTGHGLCLRAGLCEQPGFGLFEESEADQALEFRAGAFHVIGQDRQIQSQAQIAGTQRSAFVVEYALSALPRPVRAAGLTGG
jgi:hypothetical protein